MNLVILVNNRVKLKEDEKRDKYVDLARDLKNGDGNADFDWCTCNDRQGIGKGTGRFWHRNTSLDNPYYSIAETGLNTEKSPWDEICYH